MRTVISALKSGASPAIPHHDQPAREPTWEGGVVAHPSRRRSRCRRQYLRRCQRGAPNRRSERRRLSRYLRRWRYRCLCTGFLACVAAGRGPSRPLFYGIASVMSQMRRSRDPIQLQSGASTDRYRRLGSTCTGSPKDTRPRRSRSASPECRVLHPDRASRPIRNLLPKLADALPHGAQRQAASGLPPMQWHASSWVAGFRRLIRNAARSAVCIPWRCVPPGGAVRGGDRLHCDAGTIL